MMLHSGIEVKLKCKYENVLNYLLKRHYSVRLNCSDVDIDLITFDVSSITLVITTKGSKPIVHRLSIPLKRDFSELMNFKVLKVKFPLIEHKESVLPYLKALMFFFKEVFTFMFTPLDVALLPNRTNKTPSELYPELGSSFETFGKIPSNFLLSYDDICNNIANARQAIPLFGGREILCNLLDEIGFNLDYESALEAQKILSNIFSVLINYNIPVSWYNENERYSANYYGITNLKAYNNPITINKFLLNINFMECLLALCYIEYYFLLNPNNKHLFKHLW